MAAAILPVASADAAGGRLVLVGDADFASNRFLGGEAGNLVFLTNAVDWLAQDESLIQIRAKLRSAPPLLYASELVRDVAKYGNLIGVPLLFALIGAWRLARRRRLQLMKFEGAGRPPRAKKEVSA